MSNRLKTEASPYLQMHSENPVDWYPGGAGFQRAREEEADFLSASAIPPAIGAM